MAGAVIIKSKNTLVSGRSPIALGDALHLNAARATASGAVVSLADYLNPSRIFSPLSGADKTQPPLSPEIITEEGFTELNFPMGAGLAATYDGLNNAREVTIYLVFRADISKADGNGVIFRWMAKYTGAGATDKGFILRKYNGASSLQWVVDGGANVTSMSQVFAKSGYVVACLGWSVANNIAFFNINGKEVANTMEISPPEGGGLMSFGYSPDYPSQRCPMGLRTALGYGAYHDATTRAAMVKQLMAENNIS